MQIVYVRRDGGGDVTGYSRWPKFGGQEALPADHSDVAAYHVNGAKRDALAEVKGLAQAMVSDLDSSITKSTAKAAVLPFKTQFQDATTQADVDNVKSAAIAAIEAL